MASNLHAEREKQSDFPKVTKLVGGLDVEPNKNSDFLHVQRNRLASPKFLLERTYLHEQTIQLLVSILALYTPRPPCFLP